MNLVQKIKSIFGAATSGFQKQSYVYMQNVIYGQLDTTVQYIKKAYQLNADVYSIVSFIAGKVATVPFVLYEVKDEKALLRYKSMSTNGANPQETFLLKQKALQQLSDDHRLMRMLNKAPNDYMSASEFKFGSAVYRLITGNTFIRGFAPETAPDKFVEIHLMPSHMTVPLGGGAYMAARAYRMTWDAEEIPASQVSHSRYFNPDFEWPGNPHIIGQAPLQAAANVVLRSNSGMDASILNLQNGGVKGILYQDGGTDLSEPQRELLQDHIDKKSAGNSRQILAASSKLGWLKIGDNAADLGLIELGLSGLRSICNIFHVSSALFNDPTNKTYNNMSEARKAAITDAIIPELIAQRDAYNTWLIPGWEKADGKRYFIDFDASVFPELGANQKEVSEWLEKAWWITPNEKRAQQDYEALGTEYDIPFIPMGVAPLGSGNSEDDADFQKALKEIGGIDLYSNL